MRVDGRSFGPANEPVSALSLGSWHTWDRGVFEETIEVIRSALDHGVNLFDVGVYRSKGAGSIDPYDHATDLIFARAMQIVGAGSGHYDLSIKGWLGKPGWTLTGQVDNLLWRIGRDHAKYLVLGDVLDDEDFDALVVEIGQLVAAGKVRYWAVNNWSAKEIDDIIGRARALGVEGPQFAQLRYGVMRRAIAEGEPYRDLIKRTGISIQASDVFEGGLIFGSDTSRIIAVDPGDIQDRISAAVPALRDAAASLGTTVGGLAVAYPLTHPAVANVVIGTRTMAQLEDNLAAFDLLADRSVEEIKTAVESFWIDRDIVDPNASWSSTVDDDPVNYVVKRR